MDSNGHKPTWTNWMNGQPDNYYNTQDYVVMTSSNEWHDDSGSNEAYTVCQQKLHIGCRSYKHIS